MCNLILCYVDMLVCFAWIVVQLPDQRPSFLAVVRHVGVLNNKCLPRFPLFYCQCLCVFVSSRCMRRRGLVRTIIACIHCTALPVVVVNSIRAVIVAWLNDSQISGFDVRMNPSAKV